LTKLPVIPYVRLRERFKPGDAMFFHRLGLRNIRGLRSLGGWASNQGITAAQFLSSGHQGFYNYIHVEVLLPMHANGDTRWMLAGFTAKEAGGLDLQYASTRRELYPAPMLYAPVHESRAQYLTAENVERCVNERAADGYATTDLIFAESRLLHGETQPRRAFCSEFVVDMYKKLAVIPHSQVVWRADGLHREPLCPTSYSPKDMLTDLCCWDWDGAAVVG
jgi:hypothetical protein